MDMDFGRVMGLMATRFGAREALVNTERGRRFTFREYHRLTNRIANMLTNRFGLGAGDRFMPIVENDNMALLHFPVFFKTRAAAAFTNYRDSMEEHLAQVDFLRPKVVFLERALIERYHRPLHERGVRMIAMDPGPGPDDVEDFWTLVNESSEEDPGIAIDVNHHVTLFRFTGGTTGRGKCVPYSVDNLLGLRDSFYIEPECGFDVETRNLHIAPLSHGTLVSFLPSFFVGGCNFTMNTVDLPRWLDLIEAERITHSFLVPTILYRLLDLQRDRPRRLDSLRTIIYAAAPMSPAKLRDLLDCMGDVFVQFYGASEALMGVSILNKTDHRRALEGNMERLGSAGRISPGIEIVITDADGNPVPTGQTGEIRIRCRGTVAGYHDNPEATASEFIDGFWRSGDLGVLDDEGYLTIVDRLKDMIITGGFNVYAIEVEAALNAHPDVSMCAVVGIPHPEWGESVHAEVVLRAGATVTEDGLIAHTRSLLGGYKVPKSIRLVEALPMSSVGKVLRRAVRAPYWSGQQRMVH